MRGKGYAHVARDKLLRITPAHAGKSSVPRVAVGFKRDHPRPCGEKASQALRFERYGGSPPPMRGKVRSLLFPAPGAGITPAHAGKSKIKKLAVQNKRDHPRPCGEKWDDTTIVVGEPGSPPSMRGKESASFTIPAYHGITPAHAGKSISAPTYRTCIRDHPRPCGEKAGLEVEVCGRWGSPPPMRGKERHLIQTGCMARITPAHAGKSERSTSLRASLQDHPRPCGEKSV